MKINFRTLWSDDRGQDIAEYAVMLAVILVIVVGTIRLIGSNANNAFSEVASSIQYLEYAPAGLLAGSCHRGLDSRGLASPTSA
jgi:Flp pilus assembly pilin Flp